VGTISGAAFTDGAALGTALGGAAGTVVGAALGSTLAAALAAGAALGCALGALVTAGAAVLAAPLPFGVALGWALAPGALGAGALLVAPDPAPSVLDVMASIARALAAAADEPLADGAPAGEPEAASKPLAPLDECQAARASIPAPA